MGLPSARIEELDTCVTGYRTQRLPLDGAGQSQTLNAEVACKKLLGEFTDKSLGGLSFWTQPNSWHHFMSDHVVSFSTIPLSAERTLVRTTWCVHKDAVEGVDYSVDNLTAVWNATNDQDRRLVELAQAGAASSAYEPGPYSPFTEALVEAFCSWYVDRLRAGLAGAR
jgi:Rieske 2Fe-2S family protein